MKLVIEVKDCSDCPMKKHNYGHGENFDYCSHKDAPKLYDGILKDNIKIPSWCPLLKEYKTNK